MSYLIPALCATMTALLLTILRPPHAGDFSLGLITGALFGLSLLTLIRVRRTS